jgi:hypothetical protein
MKGSEMKFLTRVQGHSFLVVEGDLESAKAAVEKQFGALNLLDLSEMDEDFIIEVDLFDESQWGLIKMEEKH